jgi:hypothetical protein
MRKTSAMIEAAIHILTEASKTDKHEEYMTTLRGIPIERCPDSDIEKELQKRENRFSLDDKLQALHRELAERRSFGIKIERLKEEE